MGTITWLSRTLALGVAVLFSGTGTVSLWDTSTLLIPVILTSSYLPCRSQKSPSWHKNVCHSYMLTPQTAEEGFSAERGQRTQAGKIARGISSMHSLLWPSRKPGDMSRSLELNTPGDKEGSLGEMWSLHNANPGVRGETLRGVLWFLSQEEILWVWSKVWWTKASISRRMTILQITKTCRPQYALQSLTDWLPEARPVSYHCNIVCARMCWGAVPSFTARGHC